MIPIEIKEVQGGLQMIYHFSNGYGASVIQHEGSYGGLSSCLLYTSPSPRD